MPLRFEPSPIRLSYDFSLWSGEKEPLGESDSPLDSGEGRIQRRVFGSRPSGTERGGAVKRADVCATEVRGSNSPRTEVVSWVPESRDVLGT
jgi:hypothetical protein